MIKKFCGVVLAVVGTMGAAIGFWLVSLGADGLLIPSAVAAVVAVAGFSLACYDEEE